MVDSHLYRLAAMPPSTGRICPLGGMDETQMHACCQTATLVCGGGEGWIPVALGPLAEGVRLGSNGLQAVYS